MTSVMLCSAEGHGEKEPKPKAPRDNSSLPGPAAARFFLPDQSGVLVK
jgi:hypothetical protein